MKALSMLMFLVEYSDNSDDYASNWMNCKFSNQLFLELPNGSTVGDLCNLFKDEDHPNIYALDPYISFTAEGKIKTRKPTEFYDGMVKPVDENRILDGTEVYHIVKSNKDGSNIKDFLYLK